MKTIISMLALLLFVSACGTLPSQPTIEPVLPTGTPSSTPVPTFTATPTATPLPPITLQTALDGKKVEIQATGKGLKAVNLTLKNLTGEKLAIEIPAGALFLSPSPDYQSMVVVDPARLLLEPGGNTQVEVPAAFGDMTKEIPRSAIAFSYYESDPLFPELKQLVNAPEFGKAGFLAKQYSIWTLTENPREAGNFASVAVRDLPGSGTDPAKVMGDVRALFQSAGLPEAPYCALTEDCLPHSKKNITVSPDGKFLAFNYGNGNIMETWELPSFKRINNMDGGSYNISPLQFTPDSARLLARAIERTPKPQEQIWVIDPRSMEVQQTIPINPSRQQVYDVIISENGAVAYINLDGDRDIFFDLFTGKKMWETRFEANALSTNGSLALVSWVENTQVQQGFVNPSTKDPASSTRFPGEGDWWAFTPDGQSVVGVSSKAAKVYSLDGELRNQVTLDWEKRTKLRGLLMSRDGRYLFLDIENETSNMQVNYQWGHKILMVVDLQTGKMKVLPARGWIDQMMFLDENTLLMTFAGQGRVSVIPLKSLVP